jgi:hypothetical protein
VNLQAVERVLITVTSLYLVRLRDRVGTEITTSAHGRRSAGGTVEDEALKGRQQRPELPGERMTTWQFG